MTRLDMTRKSLKSEPLIAIPFSTSTVSVLLEGTETIFWLLFCPSVVTKLVLLLSGQNISVAAVIAGILVQ